MCNLYRLHKSADPIRKQFGDMPTLLSFAESVFKIELRDVHITDHAPIVRAAATRLAACPHLAASER